MEYSIAVAKKHFPRLLREAHEGPVIVTRRGRPDVVVMAYADYERLSRVQAYQRMLHLADQLRDSGVTASELYEASRRELETRP